MNSQEVEDKQNFLRVQILESGYDPEDFIRFLHEQTNQQTPNIQEYTMKQIRCIVEDFKNHSKKKQNRRDSDVQSTYTNKSKQMEAQQMPGNKETQQFTQEKKIRIEYEKYNPLFDYQIKGIIPCIEADSLVKQQLIITVSDMETKQIEGYLFGIGSKTQYYYHIKSNLMKGPVKRLSQDFDWLNNSLARLYPFLALPDLQLLRRDLKEPYNQRMKDIEEYLQYLSKKKFLLSSHLFIEFLTLASDKMEKFKKSYDSMSFAKGVPLLKFPEGSVEIELSQRIRNFYTQSKQFCRKSTKIHEALSLAIEKMIQSYRIAVQQTYTVVDLYAELYDTYNDMNNKFPIFKKEQYGDSLVNLNNLFVGIGDSLKSTADIVEKYAKDYYRFTAGSERNMIKLIKSVKEHETQYLQFKYNLYRKKQRVISDPSKWQLDSNRGDVKKLSRQQLMRVILPKQTLTEHQLKNYYAFNLKNEQKQFMEYLGMSTHRYYKVFKVMSKQLLMGDKNYLECLTKFIGECRRGGQ